MEILTKIKNLFKKKPKHREPFDYIMSFDAFKKELIRYYKQEWALRDGLSYWQPSDTMMGEAFDNRIRIRFLKTKHPEYYAQIKNKLTIIREARMCYLEDTKNGIKDNGTYMA